MEFIEVDKDKCNQDGICISACPSRVIEYDKEGFPVSAQSIEMMCVMCGHCVAICPTGALKHRILDFHRFESIDDELRLTSEQCEMFFKSRRSIRAYKDKPVSRDKLSRLIDIARYAPTARNSQGVSWLVITDKTEIKKYSELAVDFSRVLLNEGVPGIDPNPHLGKFIDDWKSGFDFILNDAPALVITHGDRENRFSQNDCIIALANLELAATGLGLGCCWAGFFMTAAGNYTPLLEALSLSEGHQCFGAMMVGYPQFRYHRIPIRREPKITWR